MGTYTEWYRIDAGNGHIQLTSGVAVYRAAAGHYDDPRAVIDGGRFRTPLAIYSRSDKVEDAEWTSTLSA